jgi:hemolysin activation/secretion protein
MNASVVKTGFVLKKVEFSGNTVYSNDELNKIIADKVGTYIELGQMKDLMNLITNHYTNNGYITCFAYLPAQKIKGGVLTVNVVESKVSEVQIRENKWTKTGFLKNNVFKANGVEEGKVFNIFSLKKSLGKMNEMNYLKSRVTLQKAEDNESTKIVVDIQDRYPLLFKAGWDNKGRDLIGVQRSVLTVANENITGYGDRLYVSNVFAKGTYGVNSNYFLPLGSKGTELRLGYGFSNVELGRDQKPRMINGHAHDFNIGLIQPIYEGKTFKLTSDITLDMLRARTNQNNDILYNKYNMRAIRTGLNAIKDDTKGRWISRLEVNTGIPILGATTTHAAGEGSSKFVSINPSIIRIQSLPYQTTGIFKVSAQYSPNYLLPVEQLQVGGQDSVRGFKEGTLFGDKGYFMNLELRKNIPFLPDTKYIKMKDRVALALFYDQGYARSKGVKANYKNFLQSTGFGFRINMTRYLRANLNFGVPLGRERTGDQRGMRFHFSINSDLI